MLQKSGRSSRDNANNVYTLYAANKIYDSEEGYKIGHIASSSVIVNGVSSMYNSPARPYHHSRQILLYILGSNPSKLLLQPRRAFYLVPLR